MDAIIQIKSRRVVRKMTTTPTRNSTASQNRLLLAASLLLTCAQSFSLSTAGATAMAKPKLFDVPVSNHGARCRFVIYEKGIEDEVDIVTAAGMGGLKSEEYLKLNPHGKMPLLVTEDCGPIPESDTVCRYLLEKYEDKGASFRPSTLPTRMKAAAICRLHDTYISPIQGCLYKGAPPFGIHTDRLAALKDLEGQLANLEEIASADGPFLAGSEVSLADATVWPTMTFIRHMMPCYDRTESEFLGPKVSSWCQHMEKHPAGKRIFDEIKGALDKWTANDRWGTILHAGKRDREPSTIFDKIIAGEIPHTTVYEDDKVLAFRDIKPVAPTHVLIIPKRRDGLTRLRHATPDHVYILGHMLEVAAKIATQEELEGYRVVINDGAKAGQEVFHLHLHLIGAKEGEEMKLPKL